MEDVEKMIDAKEHDHDAGVSSGPVEDTHQLDLDDYQPEDLGEEEEPSDDSLKAEDAEGELIEEEPKEDEQPPFHEHPRWQAMLEERDQLKAQVESLSKSQEDRLNQLEQRLNQQAQYYEAELARWRVPPHEQQRIEPEVDPFAEILSKPETEIVEQFQDDPRGFLTGFGEHITRNVMSRMDRQQQERTQDQAVQETINRFADEHEDFMPMVESGKIAQFIQRNPVHNAISAYWELKQADLQANAASEKEALEKQIRKDERDKTLASFRAKQGAEVLDGSQSATPQSGAGTAVAPELQETSKHGGKRNVIVSRLKSLRDRLS